MKIVVIGSVAAGTSAAAKARRNTEEAQITIYDKDNDISYSGCGLPYYVGTDIESREELTPRDAYWFKKRYDIDIYTRHEVLNIDSQKKEILVKNLNTQEEFTDVYDKLVIATGASPIIPSISGIDKENVFSVRNVESADYIRNYILQNKPKKAVVVGGGFIGLEMAENILNRGIEVTLVDKENQIMPAMDKDVTVYVEKYLKEKGVSLLFKEAVTSFEGEERVYKVITDSGKEIEADMVVMAIGVKPNISLAKSAGIVLGETGAIAVNEKMETSIKDIYAAGDCAESFSIITKKTIYRPLGSTANKMGSKTVTRNLNKTIQMCRKV